MEQILVHLLGDFILQSDYCATNKYSKSIPCLIHVLIYTSCFLLLTTSWKALLVIGGTHYILDRYPIIVKKLVWFKNHINPRFSYVPFELCKFTGGFDDTQNLIDRVPGAPEPLTYNEYSRRYGIITLWILIITDNFLHLTINYFALMYL